MLLHLIHVFSSVISHVSWFVGTISNRMFTILTTFVNDKWTFSNHLNLEYVIDSLMFHL